MDTPAALTCVRGRKLFAFQGAPRPGARAVVRRSAHSGIAGALLGATALGGGPAWQPAQIVVVANGRLPVSVEVARHYQAARGIPAENLCVLDLPTGETITRRQYETLLRDPLLDFLRRAGLVDQQPGESPGRARTVSAKVRCVVCAYGVPVRIVDWVTSLRAKLTKQPALVGFSRGAAVDSELALLLAPPDRLEGPAPCPVYGQAHWPAEPAAASFLLVAARLDGPRAQDARRLVDDALAGERYGLLGRAYFDAGGLVGPVGERANRWLEGARARFAREGYECEMDRGPNLWGPEFPMSDAAVYMGWYAPRVAGPLARPDFRFRTGAVAYHIHSASAAKVRNAADCWVGPLVAHGAAATAGAVAEPFLDFTPHLNVLADRLCRGFSWGESVYLALPAVSWQITVIGDPLYRPFRYSLEEQIEHLVQDGRPEVEWAYARQANLLWAGRRIPEALDFLREKVKATGSRVLREKLADLLVAAGRGEEALPLYEEVAGTASRAEDAVRAGAKWVAVLRQLGWSEEATRRENEIRARWAGHPVSAWLARSREGD